MTSDQVQSSSAARASAVSGSCPHHRWPSRPLRPWSQPAPRVTDCCIAGYVEDEWEIAPAQAEARRLGVPLAVNRSDAINRASYGHGLRSIIHAVEAGRYRVNIDRTFEIDEIGDAHRSWRPTARSASSSF